MIDYPQGLPCWAPGAAGYLSRLLTKKEHVAIEYGGGHSSPWLYPQVKHLHTIEHNADWAESICKWIGAEAENFTLHQHPFTHKNYIECCDHLCIGGDRILWLIDGFYRIKTLAYVLSNARKGDIILCDDALDYLHTPPDDAKTFSQKHPYAGTPTAAHHRRRHGNTENLKHPMTKDTTIWVV